MLLSASLQAALLRDLRSASPLLAPSPSRRCPRLCSRGLQRHQPARAAAEPGHAPSEADLYIAVSPAPAPLPAKTKVPFYVYGPLGFLALLGVLRAMGALMRRSRSKGSLSEDYRRDIADDKYYERMMRGMKTTQYEELTEEQILAARRRRMQEIARDSGPVSLDDIELPDNHPFAVKKKLSPEEEMLQQSRLRVRRGLSDEDMRRLAEAQRQSLSEE